jgi:hypothetical protein
MADGATLGLALGALAGGAAWWWRAGSLRPWCAALGLVGAALGAAWALGRRWSDVTVALYLDRALGSHEAVVAAVETQGGREPSAAGAAVLRRAEEALAAVSGRGLGPRAWRRWHFCAPLALAVIAWLSARPLPAAPLAPPPPPGSEIVKLERLAALEEIARLAELDPRDDRRRARLKELAERARKLDAELRAGMEKRQALSELAKLRDALAAERERLGSGEERRGLEAALGKLAKNTRFEEAQRALGDRDLVAFDEAMQQLADALEAADRERARETLAEAAQAAREAGAPAVARALEHHAAELGERARRERMLAELGEAAREGLSDEAKKALGDVKRGAATGAEERKLAEELGKALAELSDEERKRLAERLAAEAGKIDPNTSDAMPADPRELAELGRRLESEAGRKELAEELRRWAEAPSASPESDLERRLAEAERGLGDAERSLGRSLPMPMAGGPQDGPPGAGAPPQAGERAAADGSGPSGPSGREGDGRGGIDRGGGPGSHEGATRRVEGDSVRARARTRINPGSPNAGVMAGRAPGRAGETANRVGTGELGVVAPREIGAVDRSEIPEEYREQVGRYFEPR